jgi:hypothetical protein
MPYHAEPDYPEPVVVAVDSALLEALHASVEFPVKMKTVTEIHIFP